MIQKRKKRKRKPKKPGAVSVPPGSSFFKGIGIMSIRQTMMKSYYYGITIPQDIDADATIGLFDGHIGEAEWTNFTRPGMLPVGHEGIIYKVSLAVKPTSETRIVDVISALQFGDLRVSIGYAEDFVQEPLSFFPVTLYGEMAARENDPLARLAASIDMAGEGEAEESRRIMKAIAGIELPAAIGESQIISGEVNLKKALYGTPEFTLYVILHAVVTMPLT